MCWRNRCRGIALSLELKGQAGLPMTASSATSVPDTASYTRDSAGSASCGRAAAMKSSVVDVFLDCLSNDLGALTFGVFVKLDRSS